MTTQEIFAAIKRKDTNHRPLNYAMYEALIYTLYELGYHRRFIADALDVESRIIAYARQLAGTHLDVKDKVLLEAIEELKQHDVKLMPYFEMTGKGNTARVRTSLYIDNIKF